MTHGSSAQPWIAKANPTGQGVSILQTITILLIRSVGGVIFADTDPFHIPIGVLKEMFTGVGVVLLDSGDVPLGIDGPEYAYLFAYHASGAVSVEVKLDVH